MVASKFKKVILFGGSFDPVHNGHLTMANAALKQRDADELWFVPTKRSPFKDSSSNFYQRLDMIKLMIAPYRKLSVCDVELHLPEPSYTIDTIQTLQKIYPDYYFEWLIGSDQLEGLPRWKSYKLLLNSVQFIVYEREGFLNHSSFPVIYGAIKNVSSSEIRAGRSTDTTASILNYMMLKGLYLSQIVKNNMSEERYEHTLRVTDLALELACVHRIDVDRVRLAAMLHDVSKEWPRERLTKFMQAINPSLIKLHPALYHGFVSASFASRYYYIRDKQILSAIRGHVTGDSTNPIGMILFIADKCERGRNYDSESLITLAKSDLRMGFKRVKEEQQKFIRSKHE